MTPTAIFLLSVEAVSNEKDFLFQSDKIFAVMTVMLIIWGAVLAHLFLMNKKVSRLERVIAGHKKP